jgi:hypothetical protein
MRRRFQFNSDMLLFVPCVVAACLAIASPYRLTIICFLRDMREALLRRKLSPLPPPTLDNLLAAAIVLSPLLFLAFVELVRCYNRSRDEP